MARPRRSSAASEISTMTEHQQNQELGSMYDYLAKIILLGPSGAGKSCLLHRFVKNEWRVLSSQTIGVEFSSKIVKIGTGPNRRRVKLQLWDTAGTERFRSVSRSYYRGAAGAILVYDVASLSSFNALPTFLLDAKALASPNLTVILAGNKADLTSINTNTSRQSTYNPSNDNPPGPLPLPSTSLSSIHSSDLLDDLPTQIQPQPQSQSSSLLRARTNSTTLSTPSKWTATTTSEGREVPPDLAHRWSSRSGVPVTMEVSALNGENVDELFTRLARMILTKIELGEIDPDDPASGIQYGDGGGGSGFWNGTAASSIRSGMTGDEGTARWRRGGKKKKGVFGLGGMDEWEDVFGAGGRGRRCC